MSRIERLLSQGDLRSAGNSERVVQLVLQCPDLFPDVVAAIDAEYKGTRMRAADAVEKITRLHPGWLKPYKKLFLDKISNSTQKEVRWHIAQILPRLQLTVKERQQVYDIMIFYLTDKSSIVRTFAMQALCDIALQESRYVKRVSALITELMANGTPAMQSRGRKLLQALDVSAG